MLLPTTVYVCLMGYTYMYMYICGMWQSLCTRFPVFAVSSLSLLPSLLRMQSEFLVFQDSAVRDLQHSIELLEKSRTDYRAALLWMKDVSEKLRNPDYRDQLVRFREVSEVTAVLTWLALLSYM